MPPKKKNRQAAAEEQVRLVEAESLFAKDMKTDLSRSSAAWTDEQEATLFRSIISWKPVGMHKHFRMIAIFEYLRRSGYVAPEDSHTRPAGIWEKLGTLYNLDTLNETEDATSLGYPKDEAPENQPFVDFGLPEEDYRDMMFAQRLAVTVRPSSPLQLAYQLQRDAPVAHGRQSTVDDTDEPRSSPASTRGGRNARARGKRASLLADHTRQGRRGSKASIEDSIDYASEDHDSDTMDVDPRGNSNAPRGGRGGARRSGRKK